MRTVLGTHNIDTHIATDVSTFFKLKDSDAFERGGPGVYASRKNVRESHAHYELKSSYII